MNCVHKLGIPLNRVDISDFVSKLFVPFSCSIDRVYPIDFFVETAGRVSLDFPVN